MKIGRWEGNEIIYTTDVVDNSVNLIEDFDFTFAIIGADTIMTGMEVTEAAVPDMTVLISAGIAEDFTVGTFLVGEALVGTVTTADAINDRVDIVEMRRFIDDTTPATRQFKDPITEAITDQTIDTKTEYKTEIQVTPGTAAPSPVAPSTTAGWMKIAEILVPSSTTTIVDANIYNVDAEKEGDNNTSWTTDITVVYRNGTVSEMKTKIIDNEAHRVDFDDPHITLKREDVTANKTMEISKKYLVSGDYELTLPASPSKGDVIDILSDGYPQIIQNDAEHLMNLRNKYFTTKGVNGLIQMFSRERLELVYKGSGLNPIDPPVKVSALTAPEGTGWKCDFSYNGIYLAVAHSTTPYITVYKRTGDTFAKVSALTAPEGTGNTCSFSYDALYLAVGHSTTPYITVYKRTGDTFAKVSALTAPEGTGENSCNFSHDGTYLAVAHTATPFITVYKRTGDTFAKVSALIAPQGQAMGCNFSHDGTYLAVAHVTSPYITVYKRNGDIFTKVSALTALVDNGLGCSFSYDGTYLAVNHSSSPGITVYKRNGDIFTKLSALVAVSGDGRDCSFSYDGVYLAVAHATTPFITVYKRVGDTFTKVSALTAVESTGLGCSFSYSGTYLAVAHATTPFITVYKTKEVVDKEWIVTDFEVLNDEDQSDGDNGDLQYRFK